MLPMENEKAVRPPKNPVTLRVNLAILDLVFNWFKKKYLPNFDVMVTSEYRSQKRNREVGGAENSAHMHGLARDFVLSRAGAVVPASQARAVFDQFVFPHWPGFALFESDGKGYHVHVNLSRNIGRYSGALGVVGIFLIVAKVISERGFNVKPGK